MARCLLALEDGTGALWLEDFNYLALEFCTDVGETVLMPATVPHTFTRKRWRELQELIAAEKAARAKAATLKKAKERRPIIEAANAAAKAIEAAELEGENARLDHELIRNTNAIRAALGASTVAKAIEEAHASVLISQAIAARDFAARKAEEDDDEMIMLLLTV